MEFANNETKPVILAVDDKPELLKTIMSMLGDLYTVIAVTSGVTAMKALKNHTPDLFLLDIEMPDLNGCELASMIRNCDDFKKTPIVFLTAQGTRDSIIIAVEHGGNDYIVKPVEKDILLSKIARHLGR